MPWANEKDNAETQRTQGFAESLREVFTSG